MIISCKGHNNAQCSSIYTLLKQYALGNILRMLKVLYVNVFRTPIPRGIGAH